MWVPNTTEEIERLAKAGELVETPSFDGKLELPGAKRNVELAVDVAAMTPEGGVLLYGLGEDEDERLTLMNPIDLAGAADRVGQIVATSISEVPFIETREYPTKDDARLGYLAVVVPQSARAPHQVTVRGDLRFYGRGAKGNRILTEGEVARLYQRRGDWARDREAILAEVLSCAPFPSDQAPGHLHAYTRPLASHQGILEQAIEVFGGTQQVHQRLLTDTNATRLRGQYGPSLERASYWERRGADEWRLSTRGMPEQREPARITDIVDLSINIDGRGQLFCGRATDDWSRNPDQPVIIEVVVAGNLEAFFAVMGDVYRAAGYHGQVDIGVAITGLTGAGSATRAENIHLGDFSYSADSFTRTDRVAASELVDPEVVAHRLLRRFYEATTGIEGFNPFAAPP